RRGTRRVGEDLPKKHKRGALADQGREKLRLASRPEPSRPEPKPDPRPKSESRPQAKADPKPPPKPEPKPERADSCVEPKTAEPLVQELDRQIEDNPNDPDNYFKRGLAHAQKSRYCLAVK